MSGFVPGTGLTYFLSIDGVSGSVTDPSHVGALAAYGYDFTITAPADATGGGAASGGLDFGPLTVTMMDDSGLADLFELLWSGKFVSGATLTARTTGATPYDAYKLDLGQVVVTKVEDQPGYLYTVTLDYRTVDLTTYGQAAGGALTPTSFGWDQATNSQADAVGDGAEPAVAATLAATYFLLIDGLDGASTDGKHRGWFDAIGFDLEATAPWSALGNKGAGAATFAPLTVFVSQDAGITDLLRLAASGKHVSSVRLEGVMVDSPAVVYDLTLSDVVVKGVEDDNHAGPRLTLDYRAIELVTRGIAGNTLVQTGSFAYDRAINGDPAAPLPSPVVGNLPGEGTPGNGTFSYFLALDGVAGSSIDASHPGALIVSSYDFDATRDGLPAGSTSFSPLVVSVDGDTGLADVMALLTRHTHVSGATLTVRTIGAQPFDAYKLDLEDVTVIDVRHNNGGYLLTLDYTRIDLTTRASTTTGAVVTEGTFGWDTMAAVTANAVGDGAESIAPATAASKYFLLVDGVDGGSTDAAHAGWFELGGFSFSASLAGGAVDPKTLFAAFDRLDGLATLLQRAATGAPLRGVRVEGVTAGPNPVAVYDLTLSDVIVHDIKHDSGGTSVMFDYARVELMTRGQTNVGAFVATGAFGFDRATDTTYTPTSLPSLAPGNAPGEGTPAPGHDYRLILGGVPGEATDANHFGSLLVKGYRFEVTQSVSPVGGTGGASGSTFSTLSVTMADDTGLAAMLALLASGQHVPAASLMLPVTGQAFDAARFDLGDVTVQSVNDDASGLYWVTLGYRQIDLTTRAASGQSTVVTGAFGWDTSTRSVVDAPGDNAEPVVPPTAPARYFLLIDGVDGGVTAAGHDGWFDVVGHRLSASIAATSGGAPTFGALTVNFAQDTGLTDLVRRAATGAHLKGVRLEGVTVGATADAVYDLTLSNVVIERIHDVGNNGFEVTFDYSRLELITRGPTGAGGTVQTGAFGLDVASGTSFTPTGLPPLAPSSLAAHDDAYVVIQGHALTIAAPLGVLANDEAAAGAAASLGAAPLHGTVQLAATGGFTYTPAAGYSGPDSFGYHVTSGNAPASDGAVHIEVVPVAIGTSTTLNLVALTAEQQIASTYVAFFGRAADAAGFAFWVGEFNRGLPLQGATALFANIASSFGISTEAKSLYPFLVNPFGASDGQIAAFLDTVYDNLFHRASDAAGLAYWTGQVRATLAAGQFVGSVLVNIMSGAQDTTAGKDITTLMGKVAVSIAYVREQEEHHTVWAGASDIAAATALLRDVTSDPQSVLVGVRNAELIIAAHG